MPKARRILILGGTAEAREIADQLVTLGHDVTTSLAGVTSKPLLPKGKVRVGGFGGAEGVARYIAQERIDTVIDATHPFAAIMSRNAHEATKGKLIRFERPAWKTTEGGNWISVSSLQEAAAKIPSGAKIFVTTGRKELAAFLERADISGVIRTVEPPADSLPPKWQLLLDRPPHSLESELTLFKHHAFTLLITKNAGGSATRAKLDAARLLKLPVIMIQRPVKPACQTFDTVESLISAIA
jgi:precorrin-6A/cobalt-precorrin-6A reductase